MSHAGDDLPEVVQSFREALEDLQRNDQYEIENLTMIAKEATEHAQAISQEVEAHVRKVSGRTCLCTWAMASLLTITDHFLQDPSRVQAARFVPFRLPNQTYRHSIYRVPWS